MDRLCLLLTALCILAFINLGNMAWVDGLDANSAGLDDELANKSGLAQREKILQEYYQKLQAQRAHLRAQLETAKTVSN
jgi:hypothetical protein